RGSNWPDWRWEFRNSVPCWVLWRRWRKQCPGREIASCSPSCGRSFLATVGDRLKRWLLPSKQMCPRSHRLCLLDVYGQRHLHVGGHTDASGAAIVMIVAKPIGAAVAPALAAPASVHAVADRKGVMKL